MAPMVGSKRKGKEPMRKESPPHFNHFRYPSLEAIKRYSSRTITFGRLVNFGHLDFIGFNQLMKRMGWLTFGRLSDPSYPNLIRRFYANLTRPNKHRFDMFTTFGDKVINLDLSTMCRLLGVSNEGDEVFDSSNWLVLENFDPQVSLKRLSKPNSLHQKPKSKDLTLRARLILLFVQHNIFPQGGHRSESSYIDLWLVDYILYGRKVNLGYLIV